MRRNCALKDRWYVTTNDTEIVSALLVSLADKVGKERFELWFGAQTRLRFENGTLMVGAPNRFFSDWLRSNFRKDVETACLETLGQAVAVEFYVHGETAETPAKTAPVKDSVATILLPKPAATSGGFSRRPFAHLDSFVVGHSNRLAHTSAQMVAQRLGSYSPLLVHGPTGVGKTHLLEGIWSEAKKARPGTHAVYLSAEQFTTFFLEALHGSGLPSFRRKYRGVELLMIDDLQFFAGKRATLVELLHTIDTLLREGRQLVFAADRSPAELAALGPELTTRLAGGMVCRIDPPDHQTRAGIVRHLCGKQDLSVPADVQAFVAARLSGNARELAGAIHRLQATSQSLGRPITLSLAEEALGELIRAGERVVRLPDIEKAVCQAFGLEPDSLQSERKSKSASHPRMLAMWLARKHTRAALSEIGNFFGRRSHSTVISAQKRIDHWMAAGGPLRLADRSWNVEDAIRRAEANLLAG
ncbi:MAG: chromosomal replication initiator protein DnaA [Pirellulales bacterium]